MKRQAAAPVQESTQLAARRLAGHTAVRAAPEPQAAQRAAPDTRFGHDLSQAAARPAGPMVGEHYATTSCPVYPRTCPFGGACHTCPAQAPAG
jgi:hypothetical protein